MKSKEIRNLPEKEIQQKVRELRSELTNLRVRKTTGQVENPARMRIIRREIARLETIGAEKKAAQKA